MIQLPENYLDTLRIQTRDNMLLLHFVNSAGQFYTYYGRLDPAYTLEQQLDSIKEYVGNGDRLIAYRLNADLSPQKEEPQDQNWRPAPTPGVDMVSLAQYKAHIGLAHKEDQAAQQEQKDEPGAS